MGDVTLDTASGGRMTKHFLHSVRDLVSRSQPARTNLSLDELAAALGEWPECLPSRSGGDEVEDGAGLVDGIGLLHSKQIAWMYLPPIYSDQPLAEAIVFGRHLLHRRYRCSASTLRLLWTELLHRLKEMQCRRVIAGLHRVGHGPLR